MKTKQKRWNLSSVGEGGGKSVSIRGPPLDIGGGGLEFLPDHFFFIPQGRWKGLVFFISG